MKAKKKLKAPVGEPVAKEKIESPAVIGADHVQDRVLGKAAGARKGWSRDGVVALLEEIARAPSIEAIR